MKNHLCFFENLEAFLIIAFARVFLRYTVFLMGFAK